MSTSEPPNKDHEGYEASDAHIAPIWFSAIGLVICVLIVIGIITLTYRHFHHRDVTAWRQTDAERVTDAVAKTGPQYPEPRLQVAPQVDLVAFRTKEETELGSYGWVDRKAGVVRLPIDRAIDLLAQRGLPVRGDPNAPKAARTPLDMQQARPQQREPEKPNP